MRSRGEAASAERKGVAPAMARLVRWAADSGVTHLATADDHELTDPEISHEPDFASAFYRRTASAARPGRRGSPRPPRSTRCRSR